jgi:pimeloyl-ACP methyl ester carboxylesterase
MTKTIEASASQSQTLSTPERGDPRFIEVDGVQIAYLQRKAEGLGTSKPGIVWLGGFKSDMRATKASVIDAFAAREGRAFLRFDYSGHGESGGRFDEGTIGLWMHQAQAIIMQLTAGPQILVGSSMGGWVTLLLARALAAAGQADRLAGLVLIAPAVDFTQKLIWANLPESARHDIETNGFWMRASQYSPDPYVITKNLIEEGKNHQLFGQTIRSHCPVHILQGMQDPDVPWKHAMELVEHMAGDEVTLTLIKEGDHRLSRDQDLALLVRVIEGMG